LKSAPSAKRRKKPRRSGVFASTLAGGNQAFAFIGAVAFGGVAGQLCAVETATATIISGDVDGNGTADFVVTLTAADSHSLTCEIPQNRAHPRRNLSVPLLTPMISPKQRR
jgi:hypothetical protein